MSRSRSWPIGVALALTLALAACSGDDDSGAPTTAAAATASTATTTARATTTSATATTTVAPTTIAPATRYYLSLGDSYASGYEPDVGNTRNGFAYRVADQLQATDHPLELVNMGCAGATTTSLAQSKGCPAPALGPGATPYPTLTQLEAAEAFLREHPGQVDLITVSIGGNDVTGCALQTDIAGCVGGALGTINTNLPTIVQRLRAAAGPDTVILGTTYPDVILGEWVSGSPNGQQLAQLSVGAFQSLINPALQQGYASGGGQFVDVTAATGAYGPLTQLTNLPPYGSIPVPVAKVCELTYYCEQRDIHPRPAGYEVIADLVVAAFQEAQPA